MQQTDRLNILNLVGFIVMIAVNYLSNALPIGGRTQMDLAEYLGNFFVPAGFTFSIWGIIYLALAFFLFHSFRKKKTPEVSENIQSIEYLFLVTCLLNAAWLFAWHYLQIGVAMLLMTALLVTLLMIYLKNHNRSLTGTNFWAFKLPFQIYTGWISVATIANMAALLTFYNFDGFGIAPQIWGTIMIVIATILGIMMLFKFRDFAYPSVIIWALFGIYSKRAAIAADDLLMEKVALGCMVVLAIAIVFKVLKK